MRLPFDTSRTLSGPLALLLVAIFACMVAWFSLTLGERILEGTEHSAIVNVDQRGAWVDSLH